jgi:hypothetical protein
VSSHFSLGLANTIRESEGFGTGATGSETPRTGSNLTLGHTTPPKRVQRRQIDIEFSVYSHGGHVAKVPQISFHLIDSGAPRARRMSSTIDELRTCTFPRTPHYNPLLL